MMKNTVKRTLTMALCLVLVCCLFACGSQPSGSTGFSGEVDGMTFRLPNLGSKVAAGEGKEVELIWEVSTDQEILGYYVAVSETYEMETLTCGQITQEPKTTITGLEPGKTYYWKVIVSVPGGSVTSEPACFVTAG